MVPVTSQGIEHVERRLQQVCVCVCVLIQRVGRAAPSPAHCHFISQRRFIKFLQVLTWENKQGGAETEEEEGEEEERREEEEEKEEEEEEK